MFERFTDQARRVVVLAQEEARLLSHNYIGPEHLLLGLIGEGEGIASRALASLGITGEAARAQVETLTGRGQQPLPSRLPFTPQAKQVLQLALREALRLGHSYLGTEHILLGLLRQEDGPARQVLAALGVEPNQIRGKVIQILHTAQGEPGPGAARVSVRPGRAGRGRRDLLAQLDSIESRLLALERRVGTGPDTHDLDQDLAQVRRDKETAIDGQDFETAAAMRDIERELLADKAARQRAWAAGPDRPSLSGEIDRLRALLRQHGIEPQDGAA
jgi:Clp amino terminal domain, pathogenicity island component